MNFFSRSSSEGDEFGSAIVPSSCSESLEFETIEGGRGDVTTVSEFELPLDAGGISEFDRDLILGVNGAGLMERFFRLECCKCADERLLLSCFSEA